jgi:tetratricopeptide (TPR) repeat protein
VPTPDPAEAAHQAIWLARADTERAAALAVSALAVARASEDWRVASIAERALGLVAQERHDMGASVAHLRRAIAVAQRAGFAVLAAEARMSLVGTLVMRGDLRGALGEADRAAAVLTGVELARLQVQRASVLLTQGRMDEALEGYQAALPRLRRSRDTLWLARLHNNRGLLHLQRGELAAANADLHTAEELHLGLGQHRSVAHARQYLGVVASLRGDLPAALAAFDQVQEYFDAAGTTDAASLDMRCVALLRARLGAEALASAEKAVEMLAKEKRAGYLATARLRLAEAALLAGDPVRAGATADRARAAFTRQRRPAFSARARGLALRAAWLAGERSPALLRSAQATAKALEAAGFAVEALDAEILVVRLALDLGRTGLARKTLIRARRCRSQGPVQLRSRAWHAEALLRLAEGNRKGAEAALRAGMAVIERYRAALGATELRAEASGHVTDLAELGVRLALEDRRPERVLVWAERSKAGSLRLRDARPPDDARLAADLAALRAVVAELDAGVAPGRSHARLVKRQSDLEEAVRSRSRHARGVLATSLAGPPSPRTVLQALRGRALVEITCFDGTLYAVVGIDGRASLHTLAGEADVAGELGRLRFSMRLASSSQSAASVAAAVQAAEFGARRLDDLLLGPLAAQLGDRPLVIVPTRSLHALPWSILPSCHSRPVTVSPSAQMWHAATEAASAEPAAGERVFVAGPDLDHADNEAATLAATYPGARQLLGSDASCEAVSAALDGAQLAHIASHGQFRADNPMFSSLRLADGQLTVYDLERLRQPPRTLVLSSCNSGMSDVRPGDELMGLAAALLAMGTRALVASVVPVPDEATRTLMLAFHDQLRRGCTASEALAAAQGQCRFASPRALVACAGFVAFGGDFPSGEAAPR